MSLSTIWSKITSYISSTGENTNFITFMAHAGATNFVIANWGHTHHWVIWLVIGICALKEFWFDIKYETTPPQTFGDSALDFAGYMAGLLIGLI